MLPILTPLFTANVIKLSGGLLPEGCFLPGLSKNAGT